MKSRSHRPPAKDDWAEEESWTVDCICGVNFDDGEEMVNCDECGVWVHTRCSRYVKSEKSFACDKCKNKNNRNDSEETEVAQLLVELPTTTLRMDKPPHSSYNPTALPPPRRPFRLWTDIPIEERVHVQGVPGGDPALFSDLSSVFGPQLWKSTGYVPKKFNFHYKEFPSWDEEVELPKKELEKQNSRDTCNTVDNGAGVLLSMSKDTLLSDPVLDAAGVKSHAEDTKVDRLNCAEPMINLDGENLKVSRPQDVMKDQSFQSSATQCGKRKKEDPLMLKDKNWKKKARSTEKDGDFKKKPLHTPGSDRGPKAVMAEPQSGKSANITSNLAAGQMSRGPGLEEHVIEDHKRHLAPSKTGLQKSSFDASRVYSNSDVISNKDHGVHEVSAKSADFLKAINGLASTVGCSDSAGVRYKGEVISDAADSSHGLGGGLPTTMSDLSEPFVENVVASVSNHSTSNSTIYMVHLELNAKAKVELDDNHEGLGVQPSPQCDSKLDTAGTLVQYQENSVEPSEFDKANLAAATTTEAGNTTKDTGRSCGHVKVEKDRASDKPADYHHESTEDSGGSEDSVGAKKGSTGFGSQSVDEKSKCTGAVQSLPAGMGEWNVIASVGSPLASSIDFSVTKSPPANHMNAASQSQEINSKVKGTSESNFTSKKDNSGTFPEAIKNEENHEKQKKLEKELTKSSISSSSKSLECKKVFHASVSKRTLSDSKESMLCPTIKSPPLPNVSATSGSEPSTMLHPEDASNMQKKECISQSETATTVQKKVAVLPNKSEKISQSVSQSSSKGSASLPHTATSSSSPATLSDEELALLLHQELNSSPRVPRVPRMRHAGSLPQLTSPTATNMLMKRSSTTGGKEHILTFRRKGKDMTKDGSPSMREIDDETKKTERLPSSSEQGRRDYISTPDLASKREVDGVPAKVIQTMKKGNASTSGATATGDLTSATEGNENNSSSAHHSPRNPLDDGKGMVSRSSHRTLPGLIAEIMSKGERMTYEELCNAVLPHWPNLRKHNGERYAYSSHSQAVLDCLRNRSEWARLVDRGPKTSGGRKRRKLDADAAGVDSDDNDDNRERTVKDVRRETIESHHEEFPKGKRKARRRRLALQGRGVKDVRRRQRIEEFSDDEVVSFSSSGEEMVLSEDETPGVGISRAKNERCAASDGI